VPETGALAYQSANESVSDRESKESTGFISLIAGKGKWHLI